MTRRASGGIESHWRAVGRPFLADRVLQECVATIMVYGKQYEWALGHLPEEGHSIPTAETFRKVREELASAIESLDRFG